MLPVADLLLCTAVSRHQSTVLVSWFLATEHRLCFLKFTFESVDGRYGGRLPKMYIKVDRSRIMIAVDSSKEIPETTEGFPASHRMAARVASRGV